MKSGNVTQKMFFFLETPQQISFIVQRRCFYYIAVGFLFERKKIELALTTSISLNLRN